MNQDAIPFPTAAGQRNEQAPLGPSPTCDEVLDLAVESTFPASDPVVVQSCCGPMQARECRGGGAPPSVDR